VSAVDKFLVALCDAIMSKTVDNTTKDTIVCIVSVSHNSDAQCAGDS